MVLFTRPSQVVGGERVLAVLWGNDGDFGGRATELARVRGANDRVGGGV